MRLVQFPLEQAYIALMPATSNLTIRGAGPDQTLIGFPVSTPTIDGKRTASLVVNYGVTGLLLEDVLLEHTNQLANLGEACAFVDCAFDSPAEYGVALLDVDGTSFTNCTFQGGGSAAITFIVGFVGGQNPNTVVRDCTFEGDIGAAVAVTGARDAIIERCSFSGMSTGVRLERAVGGIIRDCTFSSIRNQNVSIKRDSDILMERCTLGSCVLNTLLLEGPSAKVVGTQNRLHGSGGNTIYTLGSVEVSLTQGDILNGGGLSAYVTSPQAFTPRFDLSNNYWGTTDLEQIAAWIVDGNDPSPPICYYCPAALVQYEPILSGTVPTEESSFGGLKARYGGQDE
jgi:hypothetical protein